MNDSIITDAAAPPQPLSKPTVDVTLAGIHVDFPDGWWDHPSHDLVVPEDGRTIREHRVDELAMGIALALHHHLKQRRPHRSGLVDPHGRPL